MIFDDPQKCEEALKKYIGRAVVGLRCLGDAVFLRREYIEAAVYNRLERLGDGDRDYWSRFDNIPDDFQLVRHTVVEAAFILDFDGEESLSVFFPEEEKVEIGSGTFISEKSVNFIPDRFFCRCVGKKITDIRAEKVRKVSENSAFCSKTDRNFIFTECSDFVPSVLSTEREQFLP